MNLKYTFAVAGVLLIASLQSGCASGPGGGCATGACGPTAGHCGPRIVEQPESRHYSHKYKPRFAHKTYCPSPCIKQPPFYGFHPTCWSAWPSGWQECELPCGSGDPTAPGELEFGEPVAPLPADAAAGEPGQLDVPAPEQGDAAPSPSDVPAPTAPEAEPTTLPEADDPSLEDAPSAAQPAPPVEPALPDPADEEEDEPALPEPGDSQGLNAPRSLDMDEVPAPAPTSSRPLRLRAAQRRLARPSETTVRIEPAKPTLRISPPQPAEEERPQQVPAPAAKLTVKAPTLAPAKPVVTSAAPIKISLAETPAAPAKTTLVPPKTTQAPVTPTFVPVKASLSDNTPSEEAASTRRVPKKSSAGGAVTIIEVSAAANVEPEDSDDRPAAGDQPSVDASTASEKPASPASRPGPVRRRLSDSTDSDVRPVNWIDSFLETTDR